METATINRRGQVTIPANLRRRLNLSSGDKLNLYVDAKGSLALMPRKKSIKDLEGFLKRSGQRTVSVEEMKDAVANAAAEHVMRHARD